METIAASPVSVVQSVSPSPQRKSSSSNSATGRRNRYTCNKLKLKAACCGCTAKRGCVIAEALVEDESLQIFENIFSSKREEIEDFFEKCVSGSQQTKIAREKQFILDLLNENRGPSSTLQSVADAAQAQSETDAQLQNLANEYANLHQMDISTITNFTNGGGTDKGLEDSKLSPKGNVQPIKKRPRLSAIKLRVYKLLVEHNGVSIVVNFEGASMEELQLAIASKLNMSTPITIEYLDRDFNRFVTLNQLNELRDKMIMRVKPVQVTSGPFHNPKTLEKYEIPSSSIEKLMFVEEDWFAQTWRGRWHSNEGSHFVCIKQIYLDSNSTSSLITEAKSDIQQLCEIRVQQLVNMYGYAIDPLQHSVFIVNEWVDGGSLLDLLHSRQDLSEIDRLRLCHEAVTAVNYLHHMEIIHGDIRSANFWVDRSLGYRLKLADFGFLKVQLNMLAMRSQLARAKSNTLLTIGSPRWRAPETFASMAQWTKFADIYSLGMVLFEIVTRQIPFSDLDDAQVIYAVSVEQKQPQFPLSANCSVTLQQLIQQCWHTTPEARPTNFSLSQSIYTIVEMHTKGGNKE